MTISVPDTRTRARIALRPVLVATAMVLGMLLLDPKVVSFVIWGGGSVLFYGRVFRRRRKRWLRYHDPRSFRDLLGGGALLLTALAAAFAVALIIFGPVGTGIRGFAVYVSMGAFLAAGLVMDDEEPDVPDQPAPVAK